MVYLGAFQKHLGLYATPNGHEPFRERLGAYKQGKGSVQFPYNRILPTTLIVKLVAASVVEIRKDTVEMNL